MLHFYSNFNYYYNLHVILYINWWIEFHSMDTKYIKEYKISMLVFLVYQMSHLF